MKRIDDRRKTVCSRGHTFYKSSNCPVCPKCWSGYYRQKTKNDFPEKISAPALRTLLGAGITRVSQLSRYSEKEVADLHGMGPKVLGMLRLAMRQQGIQFKHTMTKPSRRIRTTK